MGRILISKPEFEHTTRHIDNQPDITTVFEFTKTFFEKLKTEYSREASWFLQNNDLHSIMLACSVETDYLHHLIMQLLQKQQVDHLQVDEMVMQLLTKVLVTLGNTPELPIVPDRLKKYHLLTIEKAKEYLLQNFTEDISLNELAEHCHVSPFHFSRVFKTVLNISPHQYLLNVRLNNAKILLATTHKPVNDIAFECGFNSLEHFVTAYKQQFSLTPSQQRKQLV